MLQVNNRPTGPLKIKSMRRADSSTMFPAAASCSIGTGDGTDKPPC